MIKVYFSEIFNVERKVLEDYGAFNISLINDLPVFIDPFLIFNSEKPEYQNLHNDIVKYIVFLRDRSSQLYIDKGLLKAWFYFREVKQTWLGYSLSGNRGSGLGEKFASSLLANLQTTFANFGKEEVSQSSHLEKLCLIEDGIGKDLISDFTTNIIKGHLLNFTQDFTIKNIDPRFIREFSIPKTNFNYTTESWETKKYKLPHFSNDYVILTPMDMLTRDEIWINKNDMLGEFEQVVESIDNDELRSQINNYFRRILDSLPNPPKRDERERIKYEVIRQNPEFIEYYILNKEERKEEATAVSDQKVQEVIQLFITQVSQLIQSLREGTQFYELKGNSYQESKARVLYLKHIIEHNDGYRFFYVDGKPIKKEEHLQIIYRLTWFGSDIDVNREVNNGRGPVDYTISRGSQDKTLIEFKLASNSKLKKNLQNQVEVYKEANKTSNALKVILYFTEVELLKVQKILRELNLVGNEDIILIDARDDNKISASNV